MKALRAATVLPLLLASHVASAQPSSEPEPVAPASPAAPPADEPSEAEQLVRSGVELRRAGQNAQALESFRKAHALAPGPRTRAQIALAEQALGRWLEAETGLAQALRAQDDAWVQKNRAPLEEALATVRRRLATIVVECNVPGAELWLNGAPFGTLPMSGSRIVAGATTIEVRARGYETARRTVDVGGGGGARERFTLAKVAPPAARGAAGGSDAGPRGFLRPLGWASLGVGGAMVAGGIVAHVVRQSEAAEYNDDSRCFRPGLGTRDEQCGPLSSNDLSSNVATAQTLAIVGYVGGGVLAASGLVLVLATNRSARATTASVACAPSGLGGAACTGRF